MRVREAAAGLPARPNVGARSLGGSLLLGALLGACFGVALGPPRGARFEARLTWTGKAPAAREWPHVARAGESVRVEPAPRGGREELVVTAQSAAAARTLTRAFLASRAPGKLELGRRLAAVRDEWRKDVSANPAPARTAAAECGARLMARARWSRTLAQRLPLPSPEAAVPEAKVPDALLDTWDDLEEAARSHDVKQVETLLSRSLEQESVWFADASAWAGWTLAARGEAWRKWQVACAEGAEAFADAALEWGTPVQKRLATQGVHDQLLALDARAGDPWTSFASADPRTVRPLVRPILTAWLPPLALGAGAGALLSLLMLLLGAALGPVMPRARIAGPLSAPADPAADGPSLHLVTGLTPTAVTRAALELAAHRIARGERVLLVDGSARLRLHDRLGRDARWGLLECLAADMPVLGLVQYAGHPGLYLLPHGNAERSVGWSPLGRKLDEVVPHFGRIVFLLDPQSPGGIGDALRGRAMEGWFAHHDARARKAAEAATARFGIVFHGLDLSEITEATLDDLSLRVRALRPAGPAPEPAPITAPAVVRPAPAAPGPLEPIVLDCDLQVRQRLRFLAWMRRVQAENERAGIQATP